MKCFGARADGARLERMRASPLWDGEGFRNIHPILPGLRDKDAQRPTLGEFLTGGQRRVPDGPLPSLDPRPLLGRPVEKGLRVTWLGHSTLLIEMDGIRVLTDPVWGGRASPSRLIGPKRFQPVPVPLASLAPIDLVVISHDHYDHLDYPTVRSLIRNRAFADTPVVTSLGVGAHLEAWGMPSARIIELDWWESYRLPGADFAVWAAPSQHFSGRGLKDRNATLWSAMVLHSARHKVFFSGDSGLTTQYREIARRLGPFDLVMLEIGAFHPSWGDIHLGPDNALKALDFLGGAPLLPIHWGTFALAMHAWDEPIERLLDLAPTRDVRLILPRIGEPVEPWRAEPPSPWWRRAAGVSAPAAALPPAALPETMPWPLD